MLKNIAIFLAAFFTASLIIIISIFRVAEIKYIFSQSPKPTPEAKYTTPSIDYKLPPKNSIEPDSPLWPLKALKDRIWLTVTINPSKKADLYLTLADQRLVCAQSLLERNKTDLAVAVLTKGEKYLEMAHNEERLAKGNGINTKDYLKKFLEATLKHREIIEKMIALAPEDAKPILIKTQNYPKNLYNEGRNNLLDEGLPVPQNPFDSL
jgi:hypothetical protein